MLFTGEASGLFHQPTQTDGDIAIRRFLAAAEILETDLWEQYNELGVVRAATRPTLPRCRASIRRPGIHLR